MRISRSATYAISALAAAALLAACNGGSQASYAPSSGVSPAGAHAPGGVRGLHGNLSYTSVKAPNVHVDHHKSWVSPDVKKAPRLLFISDDSTYDVYIFTMPAMALKGTITGFSEPQGMCTDKSGNIWVTNTGTLQIIQLLRTGTVLNTLTDPTGYPVGCAVNMSNGDLAVTNIFNTSGAGTIELYANASGTPTSLSNSNQYEYFFPTYDTSGNLYVDGFSNSGTWILSGCPAGSSSCHTLSVSGASPYFPGGLNWDRVGGNLIIGDQECGGNLESCQYTATVSGSSVTITATTILNDVNGHGGDVDQGTLAPFSKYFAGPLISFGSATTSANRWSWPAGTVTNYSTSVSYPIGSAISNK